jgi:translation initiation factor IF-2
MLVNDIKDAMEGLLAPTLKEVDLGRAEVREAFNVTKVGTVAGCYVVSGKILRNAHARLLRDDVVIWTGKLSSLRRFKDDVKEVNNNYECGIGLENYNDVKPGDIIEAYEVKEFKTAL